MAEELVKHPVMLEYGIANDPAAGEYSFAVFVDGQLYTRMDFDNPESRDAALADLQGMMAEVATPMKIQ